MKKKILIFFILFVSTFILGAVIFVFASPKEEKLTNAQKEEALTKLLGRKVNLSNNIEEKKGNDKYKGKFTQFEYPAKAELYTYKDPSFASNSTLLESMSYDLRNPRAIFNYSVLGNFSLRFASIEDYPSVRFRENEKSYSSKKITVDGKSGLLFEKNDNTSFEKSLFFLTGGRIYTFALTGPDKDELDRVLKILIISLKFK